MSIEAISMASRIVIKQSSVKFVLIALADCADAAGLCWPSTEHVMRFTSLDRKTVISAIDKLEQMKLVADTGRRAGRTKQVKVYEINLALLSKEATFYAAELKRTKNGMLKDESEIKVPKNGTLPKTEPSQKRNPPVFSAKASQKRDTEPSGTVTEREKGASTRDEQFEKLNPHYRELVEPYWGALHPDIDLQLFGEFVEFRRVKKFVLSAGVWKLLQLTFANLKAQGVDLNESIRYSMRMNLCDPVAPKDANQSRAGPGINNRPSMNADFSNANYQGTPDDQLPVELRPPPKPARGITPFDPDTPEV